MWQNVEKTGRAVPKTPLCCTQLLALFLAQQSLRASWVMPNTLESWVPKGKFVCCLQGLCVCVLRAFLGRLRLWISCSRDSVGTGEREAEKFVCQLPALSCALRSPPTAQCVYRLPKMKCSSQESPPGSLLSYWPVKPLGRIMIHSNCKSTVMCMSVLFRIHLQLAKSGDGFLMYLLTIESTLLMSTSSKQQVFVLLVFMSFSPSGAEGCSS